MAKRPRFQSARWFFCLGLALSGFSSAGLLPTSRAFAQGKQSDRTEMQLSLGEQRVLPAEGVQSFSESVRGVIDVRLTKDATQFILVALRPGKTTLLFLLQDGGQRYFDITVVDPNAASEAPAPLPQDDIGPVNARDNIRLDFYFVQLDKSYTHQIGVGWPGVFGPGTLQATYNIQSSAFESATAVITNQALPRLDLAQASGWAKLVRQAAVVTANATKASFAGGGEVNIAIQSSLGVGIERIAFGSTIEVLPRYDIESGRIELQIHADVSDLAPDGGTGVPGRVTSTLDTIVNLELGQSLILAGLTSKSESSSQSGLPGLSQLPLIGVLFGSNSRAAQDSENVVFIVPSVVDSTTVDSRKRIKEALSVYEEYSGDYDDANVDRLRDSDQRLQHGKHPRRPKAE